VVGTHTGLCLEDLVQVSNDQMVGLLDPIILASSKEGFELSGGDGVPASGVSLISGAALRRFLPCVDYTACNVRLVADTNTE
jgi:hypothetical protein